LRLLFHTRSVSRAFGFVLTGGVTAVRAVSHPFLSGLPNHRYLGVGALARSRSL
jgi:hypothetical protein